MDSSELEDSNSNFVCFVLDDSDFFCFVLVNFMVTVLVLVAVAVVAFTLLRGHVGPGTHCIKDR